jgi:hypothetical protein
MKANKIYLLKFTKLVDIEDVKHPIYNDFTNCLNPEDVRYVGFTENDDVFIRLNDYKVDTFANIFTKYGFEFDVLDVTDSVIKGKTQKKYPEVEKLTPYLFEDFRVETTSIDDILDKINETGMDSLDKIDKNILSSTAS